MMTLKKCNICPHNCLVDRTKGKLGFCKAGSKIKICSGSNSSLDVIPAIDLKKIVYVGLILSILLLKN